MNIKKPPTSFSPPSPKRDSSRPTAAPNSVMNKSMGEAWKKKNSYATRLLKIVFSIAGAALALVIIGMGSLSVLNPTDIFRDQIRAKIKNQIGRELTISGASSFTFYPSFGVRLQDVSLSGPEGFLGSSFISMEGLSISLKLLPLLSREFLIDHIVLTKPKIFFEVDKNGLKSWDFQKKPAQDVSSTYSTSEEQALERKEAFIGSEDQTSVPSPLLTADLKKLSLDDIRIENGTIYYTNSENGTRETLQDFNLMMGFASLATPAELSGQWTWRGEPFKFSSKIDTPKNLLETKPTHLVLQVSGRLLAASFDGLLNSKKKGDAVGKLDLEIPSFSALTLLAQGQNAPKSSADPCSFSANLIAAENTLKLDNTLLDCPFSHGAGEISITTTTERPYIKARLDFSKLDLTLFISKPAETKSPEVPAKRRNEKHLNPSQSGTLPERETQATPPSSLPHKVGWSEEPYDYKALALADADASLSIAEGVVKDIKFGRSEVLLSLKDGLLETKLSQLELYEGTAQGGYALNTRDPKGPEITANLEISNIQLQPFLKDAAQMDWLIGKGGVSITLKGKGPTQKALVESLSGSAGLQFRDGAIVGINVAGLFRNAGEGLLSGLRSAPTEKTDFSESSSHWSISKGVASNNDLEILSPLLRVSGSGNVLLRARSFDYVLRPKVVADLSGQGGNQGLSGLQIPVRIHGPWEKPKFSPDVKGLFEDPNKAVETIKEIGKQFKGKNAAEILNSLFGKGKNTPPSQNTNPAQNPSETLPQTETDPPPKTSKTDQFLKQFLNPP